jgi:hypothetical protein
VALRLQVLTPQNLLLGDTNRQRTQFLISNDHQYREFFVDREWMPFAIGESTGKVGDRTSERQVYSLIEIREIKYTMRKFLSRLHETQT